MKNEKYFDFEFKCDVKRCIPYYVNSATHNFSEKELFESKFFQRKYYYIYLKNKVVKIYNYSVDRNRYFIFSSVEQWKISILIIKCWSRLNNEILFLFFFISFCWNFSFGQIGFRMNLFLRKNYMYCISLPYGTEQ